MAASAERAVTAEDLQALREKGVQEAVQDLHDAAPEGQEAAEEVEEERRTQKLIGDVCKRSPDMLRFHTGLHRLVTVGLREIEDVLLAAAAMAVVYRSSSHESARGIASSEVGFVSMINSARNKAEGVFRALYEESLIKCEGLQDVAGSPKYDRWSMAKVHKSTV